MLSKGPQATAAGFFCFLGLNLERGAEHMRIHFVQHVPFETPAGIGCWADAKGWHSSTTKVFQQPQFPKSSDLDALVVMGGPMSAYEDDIHPWLKDEKALVLDAIREGKKVLGVCLGAQIIASVLNAKVFPGPEKEIGWHPVWLTEAGKDSRAFRGLPPEFIPLHWHGDTFDIPSGATCLASSSLTPNQAFGYGTTVLALQFHVEMGVPELKEISQHCAAELKAAAEFPGARFAQTADQILSQPDLFTRNEAFTAKILENFFSGASPI